ncbi:gluconeogenesis factor YvcK family protein [Arsenicicoccus sp. oral taxon 190]|uniref:gluconeogenesis factor YvcK family protein n=1 Tax=Arsenicicoccus sp. oral taxon 190 TaxID=1658671 RepID=UPI00067A3672|nr:uridine diphosphate-N-acetylglucosamine-binding protein YvcK [Arsenicicoccus sp. oral taxon 190]AKT51771.1 hypothetical protein ADJ73_11635 [Arsenicicoccus sp. oral taxon 190]
MRGRRVVALGGGHGLAASLAALRLVTDQITAVVTVADDGGSSGRLRQEFDVLPPGDLRMALAALCNDDEWGTTWAAVLQQRFAGEGPLAGHSLGNLLILSLWEHYGDTVRGLDMVGRLLNARGRVLPMAAVPLTIEAVVKGLDGLNPDLHRVVRGQAQVASTRGQVVSVSVVPPSPPAHPEALQAVEEAEWAVLGPGSWFTSVMPHLLVPELRDALLGTSARRLLNLNLELDTHETTGFTAERHLEVLAGHVPGLHLDVVLADPSVIIDEASLRATAASLGAELVIANVAVPGRPGHHDSLRLAAAYRDIMS